MEPIGTITQYFPFLDSESKKIIQNTMNDAYNYHDFVMHLNTIVLNEEIPDLVIYFAIHHSALLFDMDSIDKIAKRYGKLPILRPNLFYASVHQGNQQDIVKVHQSADAILQSNPPPWLEMEMRLLKFEVDLLHYPKEIYDSSNLEKIKHLLDTHEELGFYENMFYDYMREKAMRDGDSEEIQNCTNKAVESATKYNDIVRLAYHLRRKSESLQKTNRSQSIKDLLNAKKIMESLGNRAGVASIMYYMSKQEAIRGEYNLAIQRNLEVIQIREEMDLPKGVYAAMLSTLYNVIGDPESGLEWGRLAEVDFESHPEVKPRGILNQVWSLILLGKKTEAEFLLDTVQESIMKSGIEILLGFLSFVSGILEMYENDYSSASNAIEDALNIYEGKGRVEYSMIFLYHLALLDVLTICKNNETATDENSSVWLNLLEDRAISDDLPGILGQVQLLKVRLALHENDDQALRELINQIKLLGNHASMEFLNTELDKLLGSKK
ncbi:MAG: hypothetical protein ACFFF4_08375 [Candidatus Thorarchaeota archaeon]